MTNQDEVLVLNTDDSETKVEKVEENVDTKTFFIPERMEGETHEHYRARRTVGNMYRKQMRKGFLFWDSSVEKTYRKDGKRNKPVSSPTNGNIIHESVTKDVGMDVARQHYELRELNVSDTSPMGG